MRLHLLWHCSALISFALLGWWWLPTCKGFAFTTKNLPKSSCHNHQVDFSEALHVSRRLVESTCLTLAIIASTIKDDAYAAPVAAAPPSSSASFLSWQLSNGVVELSDPLLTSFSEYKLTNPILLGSGGGGAVFATHPIMMKSDSNKDDIAVKVSWVPSASSVERECQVLQELERKHTRNVERCIGMEPYPSDTRRVMIALQPVVEKENVVSRVDKINPNMQPFAVQALIHTLIDMLHANIVTTDVQTLMNKETGQVLFIDFTEAQQMASPNPSFMDLALASSFCSEIIALIPSSLMDVASRTLVDELNTLHSRGEYFSLPVYELLREQEVLLNPTSIEMIDNVIARYAK